MATLLLASASPRRRDLLTAAGLSFQIEVSDADETLTEALAPEDAARCIAERKTATVAARHVGEDIFVIGADTVVALDDPGAPAGAQLLGKPADEAEARAMLEALSGSRHRVITGVCVERCSDGARRSGFERTWVAMRPILPEEVQAYVASGEWRDKAGGYAIQENADAFVTGLEEGGFDNVVGLPVALTQSLIAELEG